MTRFPSRLVSRRSALGLGGASALVLAACGNDASTVSPPTRPALTPAPSLPAATATVPAVATASAMEKELVIYSARKEALMAPVVEAFEKSSGIKTLVKSGATAELGLLIAQEGAATKADLFFTTDVIDAEVLRQRGLVAPHQSALTEAVPAEFKAPDGGWTGVIGRSRNLIVNTNLVKPADYPTSVFDLTDAMWKGRVAGASLREGGVRLWLASLLVLKGEEATTKYLEALKANGLTVLSGHTEVTNAVAQGEFAIGMVNHYYFVPKRREGAPVDLIYPDQGPDGIGTLVTPLAVAALKHAPHPRAAKAFIDFVLSPEGSAPMTTQEQEFPLRPGIGLGAAAVPGVRPIDQIKRPSLDIVKLSESRNRAIELYTPLFS